MYVERGGKSLLTWSDRPRSAGRCCRRPGHGGPCGRPWPAVGGARRRRARLRGGCGSHGTRGSGLSRDAKGAAAARLTCAEDPRSAAPWADARGRHRVAGRTAPRSGAVRPPAGAQRLPGPAARHHRPDGPHGARRRQPRQASAHPHRGRAHPAHPFQDGRQLADLPSRAALAGTGTSAPSDPRRARQPAGGLRRRPAGRRRTAAVGEGGRAPSDTSVRICSATTGAPTPNSRHCNDFHAGPSRRSDPPCWTSATWPGSATCGAARCCSCAGSTLTAGSSRSPTCRGSSNCHTACCWPTASAPARPPPATCAGVARRLPLRLRTQGAALPPLPHPHPARLSGRARLRARDLLVSPVPARVS